MRRTTVLVLVASLAAAAALAMAPLVPAQEVAVPAAVAPVAPVIPGVAEKMGRRVLSELRQLHKAMPRVVASQHATQPGGGEDVYLLYEYSDYDACVGEAPTKQAGRELCRDRLGQYGNCTHAVVAHVTIAATPRGRPVGTGGPLAIAARMDVPGGCRLAQTLAFERADVDRDERLELVVDVVGVTDAPEYRTSMRVQRFSRRLWILRDDLTPELSTALGEWGVESFEMSTSSSAARWSFRDVDRDGHPDVRLERFSYDEIGSCGQGPDGWFQPSTADTGECEGDIDATTSRWDSATDVYVDE